MIFAALISLQLLADAPREANPQASRRRFALAVGANDGGRIDCFATLSQTQSRSRR